jgi:hypothetical protein
MNCFVCNKSTANLCTKCEKIYYCGRECQRVDWAKHKVECGALVKTAVLFDLIVKRDILKIVSADCDTTIVITENWDEFSNNMSLGCPHFAHITRDADSKYFNKCTIKFNDMSIFGYIKRGADVFAEKSIYFEIS